MLRKLWKKYNVSTILVVPILDSYIHDNICTKSSQRLHILQLFGEYGFLNSYLLSDRKRTDKRCIFLMFDRRKVCSKFKHIKSSFHSLNELIIAMPNFIGLEIKNDIITYFIEIPEEILDEDLHKIIEGRYSEVSSTYKDRLRVKQRKLAVTKDSLILDLCRNNIPVGIVKKKEYVRRDLEQDLEEEISPENEYYVKFNVENETFGISKCKII